MEQTITLSSQAARTSNQNNTPSDFTTVFDRPITLDRNKRAFMGLKEINTMTYSWYNVSPDYNNNIIRYHNGTEFKTITFANGCYSYSELSNYIRESLIDNDDMEPNEDSPIKIEFDLTSFRCLVTILRKFVLDLRNSNFKELIGFETEVIRESSFGTKAPNITNSIDTLYIHCDLISDSIVDGKYCDTIYTISTANLRRSYPFSKEPLLVSFCEVNKTIINDIRIYITDILGRIINLNGVDTSFSFIIKEE